jgi:excisionase family DNA binding protein
MTAVQPRRGEQPASAMADHRPPLDVRQAARYINVSPAKVWELIRRGEIDSFKIDYSRRIMPDALDAYLARLVAAAQAGREAVAS